MIECLIDSAVLNVAGELPFNRDPKMNPGLLSGLLGRGKDLLDSEWRVIAVHLWVDTLIFFVIGAVLEKLLSLVVRLFQPLLRFKNSKNQIMFLFYIEIPNELAACFDVIPSPEPSAWDCSHHAYVPCPNFVLDGSKFPTKICYMGDDCRAHGANGE